MAKPTQHPAPFVQWLRTIGWITGALGVIVAAVLLVKALPERYEGFNAALGWWSLTALLSGICGGVMWHALARIVERLDEMAETMKR